MTVKNVLLILSAIFLKSFLSFGQEDVPSIQMASIPLNTEHPFYEVLLKKEAKYIDWLYFHCKGLAAKNLLKSPMNTSLVFSVRHAGTKQLDTISNCVHPKLYENERELEWQSEIPLYGNFPKYINFHLTNDPKASATIDLSIDRTAADIKMYVLTKDGDLVSTIVNKMLKKGEHSLQWVTKDIKAGSYLLFTEIDTHLTIHQIRIEKSWWANLFSRDKELPRIKSVIRTSYETLDIPELQRQFQYIRKNRFGTSIGLSLLKEAMVKVKLYAINGDYISTVLHKKMNAGESEFLLNKYTEKSGWYFIQLSINGERKHIRFKIKK